MSFDRTLMSFIYPIVYLLKDGGIHIYVYIYLYLQPQQEALGAYFPRLWAPVFGFFGLDCWVQDHAVEAAQHQRMAQPGCRVSRASESSCTRRGYMYNISIDIYMYI